MDIKNVTNKAILQKYADLPEDLKEALFSKKVSDIIIGIGKNHGLGIDKIGELGDETGLVMLGITSPGEYVKNLTRRLDVAPEKAKAIAEEINQKVFQPVRESLKRVHGLSAEAPKGAKAELAGEPARPASEASKVEIERKAPIPEKPPAPKPFPKREEIVATPKIPETRNVKLETPELKPKTEEAKTTLRVPSSTPQGQPPSIFVKKPASLTLPPEVIPPIFEKHVPNENKSRDPYREPLE